MPARPSALRQRSAAPAPARPRWRWDVRVLVLTGAVSASVAVAVTVAVLVDPKYLAALRDPLAVAASGDPRPYYTGWATYAGSVLWFASAALGLLAGRLAVARGPRRAGQLLLGFAVLSAVLGADDLFMVHDGLMSRLGVPEQVVMGAWVVLALAWGLVFVRDLLADPDLPVLALSAAFFAHSLLTDVVGDLVLHEESTKLAATVCWVVWAWRRSVRTLSPERPAPAV